MTQPAPRALVVRWISLTIVGLGLGLATIPILGAPIAAVVGMMLVTPIALAIAGSVLGASQWMALWTSRRVGIWWVVATALGLGLGLTIGIVLIETLGRAITGEQVRLVTVGPVGRALGLALAGTAAGFAVGIAQWLVLRRNRVGGPRWILASTLALGLGLPGGALAADALVGGVASLPGVLLSLTVAGAIAGLLTVRDAARIASGRPA